MTGSRWEDVAGHGSGHDYAARFDDLAAAGNDMHGEADLVNRLVAAGGRVLDAGCGTGRVAIELADRGFDVVGVDLDPSMLEVARTRAPGIRWVLGDLASLDADDVGPAFDVVVAAGNVVPLLAAGTEATSIANLATCLARGGLLVTGFGLDAAHLPLDDAPVTLADLEQWCTDAGLVATNRWATWDGDPYDDGGYAVNVHRHPDRPTPTAPTSTDAGDTIA